MGKLNLEYFLARRIATPSGGGKNNVMVHVATLSVAISMAVMLVSLGVIFGFKDEISRKISGFGAHITVVNHDGNSSFETSPISANNTVLPAIKALDECAGLSTFAIKAGILRNDESMQGVLLKGVDRSYDWSFFENNLTEGTFPRVGDTLRKKEVLISRRLAQIMRLNVGDPIEMLFIQNPPRRDRFRVTGIYDTQFHEAQEKLILTDLRNVQRLNNWASTQVTGFEITAHNFDQLEPFTDQVKELVREHTDAQSEKLHVANVVENNPMIFDWLRAHNVNAAVIIWVMLLVALLNMITALLIILLERTSMIGILKALGMDNRRLQKMFIIRSSFVILKGMFWGNLIGVGLCLLQHYGGWLKVDEAGYLLTTVPVLINWGWLVAINVITFTLIVSLLTLPTLIISLILPEKSIRFE